MKIEEIVSKWDMNEELKLEKINILKAWMKKTEKQNDKEILLTICSNITYYSEKLSVDTLKKITNFEENSETTVYLPVRKYDRVESSVPIFSSFIVDSGIRRRNVDNLIMERAALYLKNLFVAISEYDSLVNELKKPKTKEKEKELLEKLEKVMKKPNYKYCFYKLENIALIDDFIGSGESLISFIEKSLVPLFEYFDSSRPLNITFYVFESSLEGKKKINSFIKQNGLIPDNITISIVEGAEALDFLENETIYDKLADITLKDVKSTIKDIDNKYNFKTSKFSKNMGVASFVNAPNNNLSVISKSNNKKKWEALFERTKVVSKRNVDKDFENISKSIKDAFIDAEKGFDKHSKFEDK